MGKKTYKRVVALLNACIPSEVSRNEFCRASGINRNSVDRYLSGLGEPTRDTLEKMALYFQVPVRWLRGEDVESFWGEVFNDNVDDLSGLKEMFWQEKAVESDHIPIIIDVIKTLYKTDPKNRKAVCIMIRNLLYQIDNMTDDRFNAIYELYNKALEEHMVEECYPEKTTP